MDTAIFAIDKLYKAYVQCLRNKKDTANALKFELRREKGLYALLSDLRSRRYEVSRHIYFIVTKPSPREIFAADFRDRIVHHLLCNEIEGLFEKDFIECSYANRIGKGTHQAAKRLKFHLVRGGTNRRRLYFLKMDVKGFFRNIDRGILWEIIERKVQTCGGGATYGSGRATSSGSRRRSSITTLPRTTYSRARRRPAASYRGRSRSSSPPRTKACLIGNLTSQFFANVYLNELDHFIRDELGFERYVRYVDDLVVLDEDPYRLRAALSS